ncbi:pyridoxamine 5'-phosphate oxidase family protein [Streptomyces sp. TRM 70351]|uniref:pyridoxamine 5'-phosphate oxidase family protein n=1 Tax=Streptomyces sp. TRM 70351 TaxID=3116552 RepID=UPI002E7B101E|nr:pyridoxamine 5'-phosphate oxidase family protein [Streptomyces sp. TRM 70351]MEE1930206.1 pyridoxamine 5'-phosphate oxidase family protein [Streptomyces sp. TRM 70351]
MTERMRTGRTTTATTAREPQAVLDGRFSDAEAAATPWPVAAEGLAAAPLYWLTTVRADGRPHVTPLIGVWHEDALHFCTGPGEQKARNLAHSPHCALTTGRNTLDEGVDLVVEGEASPVTDAARLAALAAAYVAKYGEDWRFEVRDGAFHGGGGRAQVFAVVPTRAFGFAKGGSFGQTTYRFPPSTTR